MPLRALLPTQCAVCLGWARERICADCRLRHAAAKARCRVCAITVPNQTMVCGACLHRPPPFARSIAAVDYAYPWSGLVAAFKFRAALDLALRQAGRSLGEAVGCGPAPVEFVVSMGLGSPPSTERVHAWLALYPSLRFKLDASSEWTDELIDELAATGAVDSVDFKGHYRGTTVETPPDADLYRRVAEALPDAWLEDPALTDETTPVLDPHRTRVTWDAVIHSVEDIEGLLWPPRTVNVKPSRFGSIERLFAAYDYCEEHGIGAYGGGQWELGPGRGQIQLLASLFHPRTPNDVAPRGFNLEPRPGLAGTGGPG